MPARPLVVLLALLMLGCAAARAPAQRTSRVFLGYYAANSNLPIADIPWAQLTHVSHAFLALDAEGRLVENDRVPGKELTAAAHEHRVRALLCLGGGRSAEGFAKVAASQPTLQQYAQRVVAAAVENGYDGIDLDWETPYDQSTMAGFVALVKLLREGLDASAARAGRGAPYLLTATVPPSGRLGKWVDTRATAARIDWFNVMAYDMSGPWERTAGHHAPLFPSPNDPDKAWRSVEGAMKYWHEERGIPKSRLVVGLPMFGRALPVSQPNEPLDPARQKQHGALPFSRLRELAGQGWPAMWDNDSHAVWLRPKEQGENPLLICYDDRNSIRDKTLWAQKEGYRGLFFWALHQDRMPDGTHWLLGAAYKDWPVAAAP